MSREEFRAFTAPALDRHPAVQALEWIPRVQAADRTAYENAVQGMGFPEFRFTERGPGGELIPVSQRKEYFPVYFLEPLTPNRRAFGFDRGSDPIRLAAMRRVRDTNSHGGIGRLIPVQDNTREFGFLVFQPVYKNGSDLTSVEARRANLRGFALGGVSYAKARRSQPE